MDVKGVLRAVNALHEAMTVDEQQVFVDSLANKFGLVAEATGSISVAEATTVEAVPTPEAPVISSESLLATLDTALSTYGSLLDVVNSARADVKGRKKDKPAPIEAVDQNVIRAEVEALTSDPAILAELQAQADYFTAHPEANSPAVGFDILVIPEGLTAADEQAVARDQQVRIKNQLGTDYSTPYIRPKAYNDKRTPEVTGKGYRIAFAPRHYNVPSDTAASQTKWMKAANAENTATRLATATDAEAMSQIDNLLHNNELPEGADYNVDRFHMTYFRRFDQAPIDGFVSYVFVLDFGKLYLDLSFVHYVASARALVVPQKLNA
jgi:hypothetical protein